MFLSLKLLNLGEIDGVKFLPENLAVWNFGQIPCLFLSWEGEEGSYLIGSTYATSILYFPLILSGDMKHSLLYKEKLTYECFILALMSSNPYHKKLHAPIGKDNPFL